MQQQGARPTAQLAGSKTARHEPAAVAADEASKSPNRRGKKKQKVKLHSTSVTTLCQIRALRVPAKLDGYQSATGSIFQRTASAEPDLPSTDCDQLPSLVESSDSGGVCFLSCWWSLFSFLDSFYTNRVDFATRGDSGHSLVPAYLVFITDHCLSGDLECLKETPTPSTCRNAFSRARSM